MQHGFKSNRNMLLLHCNKQGTFPPIAAPSHTLNQKSTIFRNSNDTKLPNGHENATPQQNNNFSTRNDTTFIPATAQIFLIRNGTIFYRCRSRETKGPAVLAFGTSLEGHFQLLALSFSVETIISLMLDRINWLRFI